MRTDRTKVRLALAALLALALALGAAAGGGGDSSGSSSEATAAEGEEGGSGGGSIVANPENAKVNLTIGSKNFPEQEILGEIYAQALSAAGYTVRSALNLGSETVALKAVSAAFWRARLAGDADAAAWLAQAPLPAGIAGHWQRK